MSFGTECKNEDGWQLRALADKCLASGKRLSAGYCYAFTTLPLFGGPYEPDNVWVCCTQEWISFTGDIYLQTKDLPDGAAVKLKIVD